MIENMVRGIVNIIFAARAGYTDSGFAFFKYCDDLFLGVLSCFSSLSSLVSFTKEDSGSTERV